MTADATPVAAVVIAAWNAEATLARAVRSAAAQTIPVEIVVVDDASADGTLDLARSLADADPRVTVLSQERNGGPAAARNSAIAATTAPWITVLDADDFMEAGRIAALTTIAVEEGADFVADDLFKVPAASVDGPRTRMYTQEAIGRANLDPAGFVRANLSSHQGGRRELGFLKPLMSRAFLDRHGLRYRDMRLGEDYVLYAAALIAGARFVLTDPQGYVAVVRPDSLSGTHGASAHADLIAADHAMLAEGRADRNTRRALHAHIAEHRKKLAWWQMIDAARASDRRGMAACFVAPPSVILDLVRRLAGEMVLRLRRRLIGP